VKNHRQVIKFDLQALN